MEVIEAEILPYILRYVGITTLLDPALSAAVAALGLYLREGNPLEDLHHLGNEGRCSNSRQRAVVQNLICGTHMSTLKKFLVHSRRGLTHRLK